MMIMNLNFQVKKSKDPSGAFARFCTSPPIPRRRPDITSLVHKPLEQFRELLRLMRAAAASTGAGPYDQLEKKQLQLIADQLQVNSILSHLIHQPYP